MAKVPKPEITTVSKIYEIHAKRANEEADRTYLGGSILGDKCERFLWYSFRNAHRKPLEGRIARLFETGHLEEERFLKELRAIGIELYTHTETGEQFGIEFANGHGKGHLDAVGVGFVEAPKTPHLVDVKTISAKKFKDLLKAVTEHGPSEGLKTFSPRYYGQAQIYMGEMELTRAIYAFVCKDTDEIELVRFEFDPVEHERLRAVANRVVFAETPAPPMSFDPTYWECKFCDMHPICHGQHAPRPHCRTCAHATPMDGGFWHCAKFDQQIPPEHQMADGQCAEHRYIPDLLENIGEVVATEDEGDGNATVIYRSKLHPDKEVLFANGATPKGYLSREIWLAQDKRALDSGDKVSNDIRREFGAEIVA